MLPHERIAVNRLLARGADYPWRFLDSKLLGDGAEIGAVFINKFTGAQTSKVFQVDGDIEGTAKKILCWLESKDRG